MQYVKPLEINDTVLLSSNVTEADAAVWDSGTAYVIGNDVMKNHVIYRAAVDNTSKDPADDANRLLWPIRGMTNRYKMFDLTRGVEIQTENTSSIIVELQPAQLYTSLSLFGLDARFVKIEIIDGSNGDVYNQPQFGLQDITGINTFYKWFKLRRQRKKTFVKLMLPYVAGATLRVTISNEGQQVKCGKLIIGYPKDLGCTAWGTSLRFLDLNAARVRDEFNNLVKATNKRKVVERTFLVHVPSNKLSYVEDQLKSLDSLPGVFIGSPNHEVTNIFGVVADFSAEYNYNKSDYSLKVQEY
jgi:hypothetical protein